MLSEDIRTEFGLSKCNNENRYCNEVIVRYYIKKQRYQMMKSQKVLKMKSNIEADKFKNLKMREKMRKAFFSRIKKSQL